MSSLKTFAIQHPSSTTTNVGLSSDGTTTLGNVVSSGIITASSFSGNITGTATTAITAGTATTATVAEGLTGTPNVVVGVLTATSLNGSGAGITSINASNITTGTVDTARLGSGTANSNTYLKGDQTWGAAGGGYENYRVFTSSNPSFTLPASTTQVKITATGGGQGYSGAFPSSYVSGGGAGATGIAVINVSGGETLNILVGAAGANGPGGNGGNSQVSNPAVPTTYVIANGGSPSASSATFPAPAPSYQTTANIPGASKPGSFNIYSSPVYYNFGEGAASIYGNGPGFGGGGGGGGVRPIPSDTYIRNNSGQGVVIIEY